MADQPGIGRREFLGQGAAALGAAGLAARGVGAADAVPPEKILNYNKDMEYRRLGKTGLMVSAVCMGGHWKKLDEAVPAAKGKGIFGADFNNAEFQKNRHEVVSKCMEVGINYIDACTYEEVRAYSKALEGRRDKMYLGFSWYQNEMRNGKYRTTEALLKNLDDGLKQCGLEYVDLWRVTMNEKSSQHTEAEVEQMMKALEAAKKAGKARFTGFSSHDRPHIKLMIETYPVVDAVVTPYTAKSKELPTDSLFEAVTKHDVGVFGIKPFASGSLFKGGGSPQGKEPEEDDKRARLAIRYILCNLAVTAPIPGLITTHQVENVALAIRERRELDKKEQGHLQRAMDEAWAKLPDDYQWLKQWEWV